MKKDKTLVFGASTKEERYANKAIKMLRNNDIETRAYSLKSGQVKDVDFDTELVPYEDIDTVTLYINPKRQPQYYDYIISLQPNRVVFNPGTENMEFVALLQKNGIESEVACTLVLLTTGQY